MARRARQRECVGVYRYTIFTRPAQRSHRIAPARCTQHRCTAYGVAVYFHDTGANEPRKGERNVIWHIFKKDARLLWPFAALAALVHGLNAVAAAFSTGIDKLFFASIPLALVSLLSLVVLVVS